MQYKGSICRGEFKAVTSVRVVREAVAKAAAPSQGAGPFLEVPTISSPFSENWEINLSANSLISTVLLQQEGGVCRDQSAQLPQCHSGTASFLIRCHADPSRSNSFTEFSVSDAFSSTS